VNKIILFRRSQQQLIHLSFVCKNFGSCDVTVANRRKCQRCRYDRCVAAKMSPELVLNEEQKNYRFQRMLRKRRAMVASSSSGLHLSDSSTSISSPRSPSPVSSSPFNPSTTSSPTSILPTSAFSPKRFSYPGPPASCLSPSTSSTSRSSTASLSPDISPTPGFLLDKLINLKHIKESTTSLVDYSKMPKLVPIRSPFPGLNPAEINHPGFWNRGSNLSWFKSESTEDHRNLPDLIRSNIQIELPPLVEISYPMLSVPYKWTVQIILATVNFWSLLIFHKFCFFIDQGCLDQFDNVASLHSTIKLLYPKWQSSSIKIMVLFTSICLSKLAALTWQFRPY